MDERYNRGPRTTTLTPAPSAGVSSGARQAAPPSARALLLTMLGEYVLPGGGQVWTSTVLEAMGALGVGAATARQALARSAEAGLLSTVRFGRRTRWELTPRATAILAEGTDRIYTFGRAAVTWDQRWLLVLVTVPEPTRHLRHQLRVRLGWAGFAALVPGTWISPWAQREDEATGLLADLGLAEAATVFISRMAAPEDPGRLASRTWNLEGLNGDYRTFIATQRVLAPEDPAASFAALTMLVHEWRHFPAADPDLPGELLPAAWSGREAVALFHERHGRWAHDAQAWWRERA